MTTDVYYQENADKTYSLIVDGEVFKTPITNEDSIAMLTDVVDNIAWMANDDATLIVQLSGEADPLGIIVDVYDNGTEEEPTESHTFLFDDYVS